MSNGTIISERDISGRSRQIHVRDGVKVSRDIISSSTQGNYKHVYIVDLLTRMFLPAGYPNSVSPDYTRYQILNALQAFCNSLASLISSRAILQGFGVGDPTATPTKALLLTVLQDVFSRLTTILSAHFIGSSLYPEAKMYRLLADVLNDTAVVLDTLSPLLNTFSIPGLRVGALCVSAAFKSLCGISAGGSKAAITLHFANPPGGKGDVGDLNAKDASKETVLALLGMLLGTLIVPRLTTPWSTYTALLALVGLHLAINYFGVQGLILRSLNRQRLGIAWSMYRKSRFSEAPSPSTVGGLERILERSGVVRDIGTGAHLGHCSIGSSFSEILRQPVPPELLRLFQRESYLIWFDHRCLRQGRDSIEVHGITRVHICFKENYTAEDQLKAWIHAVELCQRLSSTTGRANKGIDALDAIFSTHGTVSQHFQDFQEKLQSVGWNVGDSTLMTGSPVSVITEVACSEEKEDKKRR
ncbi:vitamin B6 photo-protection and homoeostasis-domain-containing protein [Crassisporium funariophilum]|nr:vitamin B6 photo-protection and homoeostasis-domain-containing protein [Crassisporium funariophilum]